MQNIKLIIFDLDGTLVDAYAAINSSFNYVMRKLGLKPQRADSIRRSVGWGDANLLKPYVPEKNLKRALSLYRKHHKYSLLKHTHLYPHALPLLRYLKAKGYKCFKVKVGTSNSLSRVRLIRRLAGNVDIRVDANGAWDVVAALEAIEAMRGLNISCVEQPTPKNDLDAMQEVSDFRREPVMADESLCTVKDALTLAEIRACDMFNIRLSKCGGIFRSMEIMKIAQDHGIGYQIGCHVGESGILSAAAMHLAAIAKGLRYFEGCYSRLLLKEDIIEEDLTPDRGIGYTLNGPGLGVTVKEDTLRKYIIE